MLDVLHSDVRLADAPPPAPNEDLFQQGVELVTAPRTTAPAGNVYVWKSAPAVGATTVSVAIAAQRRRGAVRVFEADSEQSPVSVLTDAYEHQLPFGDLMGVSVIVTSPEALSRAAELAYLMREQPVMRRSPIIAVNFRQPVRLTRMHRCLINTISGDVPVFKIPFAHPGWRRRSTKRRFHLELPEQMGLHMELPEQMKEVLYAHASGR